VSVNESDIGNIYPGQHATFTVDAYPADVFHGNVGQIRLNATMTQNVVTYTVVVNVDNEDGKLDPYNAAGAAQGTRNRRDVPAGDKLLPYLSANLQFKVDERTDALLVPNAALHYRPQAALVAPEYRALYEQGLRRATAEDGTPAPEATAKRRLTRATIWVPDGDWVRPIKVRVGLTDGLMTEVVDVIKDQLTPETEIVTGENESDASRDVTVNPFGPRSSKRK
jgi:HlyD family secretion protein